MKRTRRCGEMEGEKRDEREVGGIHRDVGRDRVMREGGESGVRKERGRERCRGIGEGGGGEEGRTREERE